MQQDPEDFSFNQNSEKLQGALKHLGCNNPDWYEGPCAEMKEHRAKMLTEIRPKPVAVDDLTLNDYACLPPRLDDEKSLKQWKKHRSLLNRCALGRQAQYRECYSRANSEEPNHAIARLDMNQHAIECNRMARALPVAKKASRVKLLQSGELSDSLSKHSEEIRMAAEREKQEKQEQKRIKVLQEEQKRSAKELRRREVEQQTIANKLRREEAARAKAAAEATREATTVSSNENSSATSSSLESPASFKEEVSPPTPKLPVTFQELFQKLKSTEDASTTFDNADFTTTFDTNEKKRELQYKLIFSLIFSILHEKKKIKLFNQMIGDIARDAPDKLELLRIATGIIEAKAKARNEKVIIFASEFNLLKQIITVASLEDIAKIQMHFFSEENNKDKFVHELATFVLDFCQDWTLLQLDRLVDDDSLTIWWRNDLVKHNEALLREKLRLKLKGSERKKQVKKLDRFRVYTFSDYKDGTLDAKKRTYYKKNLVPTFSDLYTKVLQQDERDMIDKEL